MKAIVVAEGGVEYRDVAPPVPGPFDVQVSVKAAALNRADLTVAAGASHGAVGGPGTIVGMEWAGDVVAVGNEVTDLAPGTPVMGSGASGFAEQTVTDFGRVHAMPDAMNYEVAATLPVALATMHNAIVTRGRLTPGESVLIQGASSGVGIMGIQIAKLMGAGIVMGSSTHAGRRSRLPDFGADVTINTAEESWPDQVLEASGGDGVDLIVDQVGASVANGNMRAARVLGESSMSAG